MNIHAILRAIFGIGECRHCAEAYWKPRAFWNIHDGFCSATCQYRYRRMKLQRIAAGTGWRLVHEDGGQDVTPAGNGTQQDATMRVDL